MDNPDTDANNGCGSAILDRCFRWESYMDPFGYRDPNECYPTSFLNPFLENPLMRGR